VLARVSEHFATSLDLEVVLNELCQRARELSGADSAWVRLPDDLKESIRFTVDFSSALQTRPPQMDPFIEQISQIVTQAARPAVVEDVRAHPQFGPQSPDWLGALAAYPLRRGPEVIGTLTVVFPRPRTLSAETRRLLAALADHASIAVRNAQLHERMETYARTDALTGLANRRSFNDTLTNEVRRARRYKMPLALIMGDVVGLKGVNDEHGHLAGDTLLCAAAEALRNSIRLTDLAARFGGDEFAVILPATSGSDARLIAERIQNEAARLAFDWNGVIIPVNVTLGVSAGEADSVPEAAALLTAADHDLYGRRGQRRGG
jgi:diguanylate cyclase (GGDEF)-like protein